MMGRVAAAAVFGSLLSEAINLGASSITAASCSASDVQAALNQAHAGDTVNIPAGTCHWTTGLLWTAPANVTIRGAGDSSLGGGDRTVIVDDFEAITICWESQPTPVVCCG